MLERRWIPWSQEELSAQKRLTDAGASIHEISEYFGGRRSPGAILTKLTRIRTGPKRESPWTEEKLAKLVELAPDHSAGQIGLILGFTRNAVIGKLHRLNAPLNPKYREERRASASKRVAVAKPRSHNPRQAPRVRVAWQKSQVIPMKVGLLDYNPSIHCASVVDGETDDNCLPIYCGHPRFQGRSYCFEHCREYYNGFFATKVSEAAE